MLWCKRASVKGPSQDQAMQGEAKQSKAKQSKAKQSDGDKEWETG